jgi:translocation and assembly module TamB
MTTRVRWIAGLSLAAVAAAATALAVLRSQWFEHKLHTRIVAAIDNATGGRASLERIQFDWRTLHVVITGFLLHGTEPAGEPPLFAAPRIDVNLRLFGPGPRLAGISFLGLTSPSANIIVNSDGATNIPTPPTPSTSGSPLSTIVNLAIGRFDLDHGTLDVAGRRFRFSAHGRDLRALLAYDRRYHAYQGRLGINPLSLALGAAKPLDLRVDLPVSFARDEIVIRHAALRTQDSHLGFDLAIHHIASPVASANILADVSLADMRRLLALPPVTPNGAQPRLGLNVSLDAAKSLLRVSSAHLRFGKSSLQAAGNLMGPAGAPPLAIHSQLNLDEIARLLNLPVGLAGAAAVEGDATLSPAPAATGRLTIQGLAVSRGDLGLSGAALVSSFHAGPEGVSLPELDLTAIGGRFAGAASLSSAGEWDVRGRLSRFALPALIRLLTSRPFGYSGAVSGGVHARGAAQRKALLAEARFDIAPDSSPGVPIAGHVDAVYSGAHNSLVLTPSYLTLPRSRIDLRGLPGAALHIHLVTRSVEDLEPAIVFASNRPSFHLPVRLRPDGTAGIIAEITGPLDAPAVAGRASANSFSFSGTPLESLSVNFAASASSASLRDGLLTGPGFESKFNITLGLSHWQPQDSSALTLRASTTGASLTSLAALLGPHPIPLTGTASGEVQLDGTLGKPSGSAAFVVAPGTLLGEPLDRLDCRFSLAGGRLQLDSGMLASGPARLSVTGAFDHDPGSWTTGKLQARITGSFIPAAHLRLLSESPSGITAGDISLTASASAAVTHSPSGPGFLLRSVDGSLQARGLTSRSAGPIGDLTLFARTSGQSLAFDLDSSLAGASLHASGSTKLIPGYPVEASATIRNFPLHRLFTLIGLSLPLEGVLSAEATLDGSLDNPRGAVNFRLQHPLLAGEKLDAFDGLLRLSSQSVALENARLAAPAGILTFTGSFRHPSYQWTTGQFELRASAPAIDLARLGYAQLVQPGSSGVLHLDAIAAGDLAPTPAGSRLQLRKFEASAQASKLAIGAESFGQADLIAHTTGNTVALNLDSDFAGSSIHGSGSMLLEGPNPVDATIHFSRVTLSGLRTLLGQSQNIRPDIDAVAEGSLTIRGPAFDPDNITAALRINRLEASASRRGASTPGRATLFTNQGVLEAALAHGIVQIKPAHLSGRHVNLIIGGSVPLDAAAPLRLDLNGAIALSLLQEIDRDIYSGGDVTIDATLRGARSHLSAGGQIKLQNASLNLTEFPNGISQANGVIVLSGLGASVRNLTGETGGGKFSLTGSVDFSGTLPRFNLKASAQRVRVRYAGVSVTSDATLSLSGVSGRAALTGDVVVNRLAFGVESDLGSLLSLTSTPVTTPAAPSPILSAVRLDVHIRTSPGVRFQTAYTERLEADADLNLRGTLDRPGLLGKINVTQGQIVFFGNQYTVNQGSISFFDTNRIEPILNVSLETQAQGVDVVLGVSGPMDNMKLTYRSDPPLQFSEIVGLLALGSTPSTDATIAAHQPPAPQESFGQMGESAVVGQALATPLANRIQRVFGITQLRIDPAFTTGSAIPLARVTLQQQVSSNILFTYTTDLSAGNSQSIRVEWAISPRYSAVATRDENGILSFDLFYKKQFR